MKIKSDIIWAVVLVGTAVVFFYLGKKAGIMEAEEIPGRTSTEKSEEINALERKIEQLSEELTSRGIYSYPQANVVSEKNDNAEATVVINLNGRETIRNLKIERKLLQGYPSASETELEEFKRKGPTANVGNLTAHNPVAFEIENFENEIAIKLIFNAEGNQWKQYILASKIPTGEIKTFWVITNKDSEVIDKHIDEDFPTDNHEIVLPGNKKVKYSEIRMNSVFRPFSTD